MLTRLCDVCNKEIVGRTWRRARVRRVIISVSDHSRSSFKLDICDTCWDRFLSWTGGEEVARKEKARLSSKASGLGSYLYTAYVRARFKVTS